MQLLDVLSAKHTDTDGTLELSISADIGNGTETLPYGWRAGDPFGLGPQVDEWMIAHPSFPVDAYVPPIVIPAPPHLNGGMLIRFSATNPIVVYENLGLSGVSRLTKGRYRINHINPMPSDQYSVSPDVMDALDRRVRYTVRTVDYVEVKVVDTAGAPADAAEVSVKIERVVTPT